MRELFEFLHISFANTVAPGTISVSPGHDPLFILVAFVFVYFVLVAGIALLRQEGLTTTQQRLLAGVCLGGGVWFAHAAGVLALQLPASTSIDAGLLHLALVVSVCGTLFSLALLGNPAGSVAQIRLLAAGVMLGFTQILTHHLALGSLIDAGSLIFVPDLWVYAQLAALIASSVAYAALVYQGTLPRRHNRAFAGLVPSLLLLFAVLGQHFMSGEAMAVHADMELNVVPGWSDWPGVQALVVGVVLTSGLAALLGLVMSRPHAGTEQASPGGYGLEHLLESVPDSMIVVARSGAVQRMNRAAMELFDVDSSGISLLNVLTLIPGAADYIDSDAVVSNVHRYLEMESFTVGGRKIPLEVSISELQGSEGDFFVLLARDISVRKRVELHIRNLLEENRRLATTDTLTGLPNRRHILDTVGKEISRCSRHGHELSVLMIDIDHFKRINDTHGHAAGDQALREMAEVVRSVARSSDLVSRFGGEEFLLVLTETGIVQARLVAERLREQVTQTMVMTEHGDSFSMTISVGVAQWATGKMFEDIVAQADRALYNAKSTGRNRVVIYSEELPSVPESANSA